LNTWFQKDYNKRVSVVEESHKLTTPWWEDLSFQSERC
jgi:hypothetical protein